MLRIDLGCGYACKAGFVGVDRDAAPGVEHVVDLERERLPFADRSVDEIFSSHCFEHLADHAMVFHEMSRVARDGAALEIWTPYAWTDEAFLYTHRTFFTELHYRHPCVEFPDHWPDILGARWQLVEFQYVVKPDTIAELAAQGLDLAFAVRHLHNVVVEFGTHLRIWHEGTPPVVAPRRTVAERRDGPRVPLGDPGSRSLTQRLRASWRALRAPPVRNA